MLYDIKNYINSQSEKNDKSSINYYLIYKKIIDKFYSDKDDSIYKINFVFYDKFKIQPENFVDTLGLCNERIGQTKFRTDIVNFYSCCIISEDDPIICQACHIVPYSETKFNHIDNGLLLNYNLHHLYDLFLITFKFKENINDTYNLYFVVISEKILNKKSFSNYIKFNNKIVKINANSKNFLEQNYKKFLLNQKNLA